MAQYFTVFDRNYAARGLLMLDSLRRASPQARTTVLALDDDAARAAIGHCDDVLRIQDLGDLQLEAAQSNRSHEEFCWTCAPVLSDFMVRRSELGSIVIYVDADLFFYSDPAILLAEMGNDKNIMIHPHRYSADKVAYEASSGIFNVGFVAFRVSEEAKACTARWRQQVLDLCVKDPARGLCGDQGYLNDWPLLYPGLRVMQNVGGGVAPWNVSSYHISGSGRQPIVDGRPVIFYHFHQLQTISSKLFPFAGVVPAAGYNFDASIGRIFYLPYVRALKRGSLDLRRLIPLNTTLTYSLRELAHYVSIREVLSTSPAILTLPYLKRMKAIVYAALRPTVRWWRQRMQANPRKFY